MPKRQACWDDPVFVPVTPGSSCSAQSSISTLGFAQFAQAAPEHRAAKRAKVAISSVFTDVITSAAVPTGRKVDGFSQFASGRAPVVPVSLVAETVPDLLEGSTSTASGDWPSTPRGNALEEGEVIDLTREDSLDVDSIERTSDNGNDDDRQKDDWFEIVAGPPPSRTVYTAPGSSRLGLTTPAKPEAFSLHLRPTNRVSAPIGGPPPSGAVHTTLGSSRLGFATPAAPEAFGLHARLRPTYRVSAPITLEDHLDDSLTWPLNKAKLARKGYRLSEKADRERLEFHGDRLLSTYISELLTTSFPRAAPGELTRLLSQFVSNDNLARLFDRYRLNVRFPGMPPLPSSACGKSRADFVEMAIAAYYYTVSSDTDRLSKDLLEPLFRRQLNDLRAARGQ